MFRNYLVTALRGVVRNKLFSLINTLGLAFGFAASLLIFLFVQSEVTYDSWVEGARNVYRVEATYFPIGRDPVPANSVGGPMRDAVLQDFPSQITHASRIFANTQTVQRDDAIFNETVNYVDEGFFQIINLTFLEGSPEAVLADTSSLAISRAMRQKYFGNEPALGQILTINLAGERKDFKVVAVIEDLPENSHMLGDFWGRLDVEYWTSRFPNIFTRWTSISSFLYVRLADGVSPADVEAGFPAFADRHEVKPQGIESYLEMKPHDFVTFKMVNLQDIHLYSEGRNDFKPRGSVFTVLAFTAIAVLLVAIAVVNFINLATAIATRRVREVAMRKTLGAMRRQIMVQFLGEAGLMVIVSLALALIMVEAALPYYNDMLGSRLSLGVLVTPLGALGLAGFALFVGVAAGAYPAFRISGIRPGRVLHSNRSEFSGSGRLRSLLVTFQFAISIALIAGTIVLYQQTSFVNDLELGYQTDNITVLRLGGSTDGHGDALRLKQALLGIPGVESVGISGAVPSDVNIGSVAVFSPVLPGDTSVSVRPIIIGYDFFDTYGIEPLEGRLISQEFPSDIIPVYQPPQEPTQASGAVLLNESAVRKLGFENNQQAMGQVLKISTSGLLNTELTIVGIIPDIHFESAREQIQPAIYYYLPLGIGSLSIRIRPGQYDGAQEAIDQVWREAMPTTPMLKQHMDQLILDQYQPEQRQSYVLTGFSVLTILVACLGLFGLAAFSAERRTKEVGIRKVMGASTAEIVRLFVWSFSKPLLVANVIAWPAAWYVMDDWLTSFAYRIDLTAPPFLISGLAVAILGGITVAGRTFAAAKARPINALRYE